MSAAAPSRPARWCCRRRRARAGAPTMSESDVAATGRRVSTRPALAGPLRQFRGVDEVAVVARARCRCRRRWCGRSAARSPTWSTRRGVPAVADGHVPRHRGEGLLVEHLADQAEVLEDQHLRAVGDGDARSFLAAVLQRIKPVIGELRHILTRRPDTENPAFFAGFVLVLVGRVRGEEIRTVDRQIGSGHRGAPWGWACEGQGQSTCPARAVRPRCRSNRPDSRTNGPK